MGGRDGEKAGGGGGKNGNSKMEAAESRKVTTVRIWCAYFHPDTVELVRQEVPERSIGGKEVGKQEMAT